MRRYLPEGTWVRFPDGECYEIAGPPIGEGGGSVVYPAFRKRYTGEGRYESGEILYALKECFPVSVWYQFVRSASGEIVPAEESEESQAYLLAVQSMQLEEHSVTEKIYKTGFRLTPTVNGARRVELSSDNGKTFEGVNNTFTAMEALSGKGRSMKSYLSGPGRKRFSVLESFQIVEKVLLAVREIHQAGFLHLDIQDGNIFLKGSLEDDSYEASLIDFGTARKREKDGKCGSLEDGVLFTTEGFTAPEMLRKNDGALRFGPEADLYSIGYLLLLLLTGERRESAELERVKDGRYLRTFDFRKVKCPAHLKDCLQKILAGALVSDPEKRYHSCDEMLKEVRDLEAALKPYRSELAQVEYDAFICYEPAGLTDGAAAKKLQECLEHFHASYTGTKKRIRRVFVDQGELSGGDHEQQIEDALRQAGWLIVLCSPGTKNSQIVRKQIQTFLKYHDRSRLQTVVTEGAMEEVIPEETGGAGSAEPIDARGKDLKAIRKKLRKDVRLRVAAPILGTTYDTLKQRHRVWRMQRIAAVSVLAMLLGVGFGAHATYQAARIREQNGKLRENQARYLAGDSLEELALGDRIQALLLALSVEPEKEEDGPAAPEQMYALNCALSSYQSELFPGYAPESVKTGIKRTGRLSSDGAYYGVVDGQGMACLLSGQTGRLEWGFAPAAIEKAVSDPDRYSERSFERILDIFPLKDGRAAVWLTGCMAIVDIKANELLMDFPTEMSYVLPAYDLTEDLFAYASGSRLYLYDLGTGKKKREFDFDRTSEKEQVTYRIRSLDFAPDGSGLAVGLSYGIRSGGDASQESPMGLAIYDPAAGELRVISEKETVNVLYAAKDRIAAIHGEWTSRQQLAYNFSMPSLKYHLVLYEPGRETPLYESGLSVPSGSFDGGFVTENMFLKGKMIRGLAVWSGQNLQILDMDSGESAAEQTFEADITGAGACGLNKFFVGFANGTVETLGLGSNLFRNRILELSGAMTGFQYNPTEDKLILRGDDRLIFCGSVSDPDMQYYECGESRIEDIWYVETEDAVYRCLKTENGIQLFRTGESEPFYTRTAESGSSFYNIGVFANGGKLFAAFVECTKDGGIRFIKDEAIKGECRIVADLSEYRTMLSDASGSVGKLIYSGDGETMFAQRKEGGVIRFDISEDTVKLDGWVLPEEQRTDEMELTGDGNYLVLTARDANAGCRRIWIYDIASGKWNGLKNAPAFSDAGRDQLITVGTKTSRICLYDGGDRFVIADCADGAVETTIPVTSWKEYDAAFFDQDQYLLLSDGETVSLYNVEEPWVIEDSAPGTELLTDSSGCYFALKDSQNMLHIYLVNSDHRFCRFADVKKGTVSFSGQEILQYSGGTFAFSGFQNYARLKEKAQPIVKEYKLSEAAQQRYDYIGE